MPRAAKAYGRKILQGILKALSDLVYPPACLHCNGSLEQDSPLLCHSCLQLMEMISPEERCQKCFSPLPHTHIKLCGHCLAHPQLFEGVAAVFDFLGPAATLVKKMKYANMPYLAEGLAAYLTAQFVKLNWPLPDGIVPVPLSRLRRWDRGYNQSALLACHLANYLQVPMYDVLKRRSGDFSQAMLNRDYRLLLEKEKFRCVQSFSATHKTLLLIDDVMTTGSTLHRCAEVLQAQYPSRIYALVVCKAAR